MQTYAMNTRDMFCAEPLPATTGDGHGDRAVTANVMQGL